MANRRDGTGDCGGCGATFGYMLIHNGFNESAHAYCDRCGTTALFDAYPAAVPEGVDVGLHGELRPDAEALAQPCACGGTFRGSASPRCPSCLAALSANDAAAYIERNALGASKGLRWQRSWRGLYAIVVEDRLVRNPWCESAAG